MHKQLTSQKPAPHKELTVADLAEVSGGGIERTEIREENTFGKSAERSLTIEVIASDGTTIGDFGT